MAIPQKLERYQDKKRAAAVGLKTAMSILEKWGSTPEQMQAILQMSKASFYKLRKDPAAAQLSHDQFERISYLLNIHGALRTLFENPENVYGFMAMKNHTPYFNGQAPLELIGTGHFGTLYEVYKHIDALRGGIW
ncbi:DUF2384 domain-containing protein [Sodalis ligni]|jgi:uncharacterized protein (DUF2384 family)|uniref:Uncharacterized protein DUF2384 n=1 Tax=Sodalis ligni TaxID=2697027 RepID=A0A4R1NEH0_9GAMM|nr:MbcA/ParS/Xre antitoxin family protein [Sodalis ligni]QWA08864.1 DUF2384 domain-containing protein [Sodalis ligni]TCL02540.1 uncharacterized protein DUF2384 [Sodalis ligni]